MYNAATGQMARIQAATFQKQGGQVSDGRWLFATLSGHDRPAGTELGCTVSLCTADTVVETRGHGAGLCNVHVY